MQKGVKAYATKPNKVILTMLRAKGYTITDLCKFVRADGNGYICSRTAEKYVNNPNVMRLSQLREVAAMVDVPIWELVAKLHVNSVVLPVPVLASLRDIVGSI